MVLKDLPYSTLNLKWEVYYNPNKWKPEMRSFATFVVSNNVGYYFGGISG